jgi:hypothetical protein
MFGSGMHATYAREARMTEGLAFEPPDEAEGWRVLGPDGTVIASGGQTVTEASADAGQET